MGDVVCRESPEASRLRQAFELYDAGVSMMRARLRREHPEADEASLERMLREWLWARPGAEHGDAEGRPRPFDPRGA